MIPTNNKVLVRVNLEQKDKVIIAGVEFSTALKFDSNHREKSPVIAEVISSNELLKQGDFIVCHHNHFYPPSPYHLQGDLYSIPFNHTIFAKINKDGTLSAMCGNILGKREEIKSEYYIPAANNYYTDRITITDSGDTEYIVGQKIFTRPSAPYDIVYNWDGIEKRVTKVNSEMICAVMTENT
jgi:hypothetical protein